MVSSEELRAKLEYEAQERLSRFRILVCIDGEDECYRGLEYAARMGGMREDCDIVLLYVRPIDQGLASGGLQIRLARENMLEWGIELPGLRYLKRGLEILTGGDDIDIEWDAVKSSSEVEGDPLGDHKIEYKHSNGCSVILKLKTAPDVASGILSQYELGPYNLIILGSGLPGRGRLRAALVPDTAEKVALHAPCSVLVTRSLLPGNGHLVCVDGTPKALAAAREEALIAARFPDPKLSAICVAPEDDMKQEAKKIVDSVARELKDGLNFDLKDTYVSVGNIVDEIVKAGETYSVIVLGGSTKSSLQRMVTSSVPLEVMRKATNSVMIIR